MKTIYDIKKLDCQSCAMMIEGICEDMNGVQRAEVRIRQRQLDVEHDDHVTAEQIEKILSEAGYPVAQRS
jgi:copper chaperone CopZ